MQQTHPEHGPVELGPVWEFLFFVCFGSVSAHGGPSGKPFIITRSASGSFVSKI